MEDSSTIKVMVPHVCPHCRNDVIVEMVVTPPRNPNIYTPAQIFDAKIEVQRRINLSGFPRPYVQEVEEWLMGEDVIVTPDEIDDVVQNVQLQALEWKVKHQNDIAKTDTA